MKSFGIWYKPTNIMIDSELNLHINLWRLPYKINRRCMIDKTIQKDFLDFGLKFNNFRDIEYIKFAIPFHIEKGDIICLYEILMNCKLLRPLFNFEISIHQSEGGSNSKINWDYKEDDKRRFIITKISEENIQISYLNGYSIVKFTIPEEVKALDGNILYFRIRIIHSEINKLTYCYRPKNSALSSAFYLTEICEFLINRKRNIPEEVRVLPNEKDFNLKLVNFFLLHEADDVLVQSHKVLSSLRRLETDIWQDYINDSAYSFKNIFAYQWNDDADDNNFNALIKIRREKNNLKTIFVFIILLGFLTIAFNLISNCIQRLLY